MPTRPIALELSRREGDVTSDARPTLVGVVEDLISLLETQMPDETDFPSEPLRARLTQSRMRVRTAETLDALDDAGRRIVGDASQVLARIAGHNASRESEFLGVIRLLRELVDALRGDAQAFRADVTECSDRVADVAQMDDIRTLRRALNREVEQLRRSVQTREAQDRSRLAEVSGQLQHMEGRLAETESNVDRPTKLPQRDALERQLGPASPCTLIVVRIDESEDIVAEHARGVLDRVILCAAQVLQATFGSQTQAYRIDTHCVAVAIAGQTAKSVSLALRHAQARLAPEYEYQSHGITRSVMFTFSSGVADRHSGEPAATLIHRTETLAARASSEGRGRMGVAASRLGRLLGWF